MEELQALIDLQLAQQVGAEADRHAGRLQISSERSAPSITSSFLASMSAVMPNCAARSFIEK